MIRRRVEGVGIFVSFVFIWSGSSAGEGRKRRDDFFSSEVEGYLGLRICMGRGQRWSCLWGLLMGGVDIIRVGGGGKRRLLERYVWVCCGIGQFQRIESRRDGGELDVIRVCRGFKPGMPVCPILTCWRIF